MRRTIVATIAAALTGATGGHALALCQAPSFTSALPSGDLSSFARPEVPPCLAAFHTTGKHTCATDEIDIYVAEAEDYVEELEAYGREATVFANRAIRFANDAQYYAKCESEEIAKQHK